MQVFRRYPDWLIGALLMSVAILVLELLDLLLLGIPFFQTMYSLTEVSFGALLSVVILTIYRYGWPAGVSSTILMIVYRLYYLLYTEQTFPSESYVVIRAFLFVVSTVMCLVLVGVLKRDAQKSSYLEAERSIQEAHAKLLEDEVSQRTLELQAAIEQLKEMDRLKSDFINAVSHELRTPLSSIQGYAEFLEDRLAGELTAEQARFVCQIQGGAQRLRTLVDDLLDFARLQAGTFTLVMEQADLAAKIHDVIRSLYPAAAEKQLTLTCKIPQETLFLEMDAARIDQVLLNLLGNAIKFSCPGGQITIKATPGDDEVTVVISDTGLGIAPEHLPKLFTKFYQVDASSTRAHGGTGLGLAISRSIIEAHGGRIGVESTLGKGSTFWFTLPCSHAKIQPSANG